MHLPLSRFRASGIPHTLRHVLGDESEQLGKNRHDRLGVELKHQLRLPLWYPPLARPTGFPSIVVPAGFSSRTQSASLGVPVGIEFLGRPWSEKLLIEIGYGYEQGTRHRRAPTTTPPL